jgi:hypothetical protein
MWWIVTIVAVVAVVGFFEWRARNKPLTPVMRDRWSSLEPNEFRPMTGGHSTDERR